METEPEFSPRGSEPASCRIRPYRPDDREAVRRVCCDTGFMGDPVDPLFSDRDAFADFFTSYYTDYEPDHCLVLEAEGAVTGYILCCLHFRRFPWVQGWIFCRMVPRFLFRLLTGKYNKSDLEFLRWLLLKAGRQTPSTPKRSGHFHFNILPGWRGRMIGLKLFLGMVEIVRRSGSKRVYGQIQTFPDRRSEKVFRRYGLRPFDRRKVTKFDRFGVPEVYVTTLLLELD